MSYEYGAPRHHHHRNNEGERREERVEERREERLEEEIIREERREGQGFPYEADYQSQSMQGGGYQQPGYAGGQQGGQFTGSGGYQRPYAGEANGDYQEPQYSNVGGGGGQDSQQQYGGGSGGNLRAWPKAYYSLRNEATGMYLAAHPDGQLVAEDDTTNHHDLVWKIYDTPSGGVALSSCHGKYLTADGGDIPSNNAQRAGGPETDWQLEQRGSNLYRLRSQYASAFLSAVPPQDGQQAVFLARNAQGAAETWEIQELTEAKGLLSRFEGAVF